MDILYFRRFNGRFYISFGFKGYMADNQFNDFLNKIFKDGKGSFIISNEKTPDSIFKVKIMDKDDCTITDFYNPEGTELIESIKQCKTFTEENNISSEVYLIQNDN